MAGGIIPLRRATLSRFGGRLRQESALHIEDFGKSTPNSRFVPKLPTAPTHLSSSKPGCALWIS
jgi:hypothetical protein